MSVIASSVGFSVALPPDWLVLDVAGERIPAQVERLLDEAVRRDEGVRAHRGMIERQIRSVLRNVRSQDLSFCAMLATVIDDVLPMYATITGTLRSHSDAAELSEIAAELQRDSSTTVSRCKAGDRTAVRAQRRTSISDEVIGAPVEAAVWQYFIPSGVRGQVAILTAATPVLALEEHFGELFDAIIGTFSFTPHSESTEVML